MTIFAYAAMWAGTAALAALLDNLVWLRYVRPALERSCGWPPVDPGERIPMSAAAAGGCAVFILLFVLPWVGVSAGY